MLRNLFTSQRFHCSRLGLSLLPQNLQVFKSFNGLPSGSFRVSSYQSSSKTPVDVSESRDEDVLTQKLQGVKSFAHLMVIAGSHCTIMNNKHLALTFDVMNKIFKSNRNSPQQGVNNEELKLLCSQVVKRARHFSTDECLTILSALKPPYLNVPSKSAIVQSICQMIRHSVNDLSLRQLLFLHFLLQKFESTPLIGALKLAIPIVVQAQMNGQMDIDNVKELYNCFQVITESNGSMANIEKLCANIIPKCHELDVFQAYKLMSVLTDMPVKPVNYCELIAGLMDVFKNNLDKLPSNFCEGLLFKIHKCPELASSCPSMLTVLSREAKARNWELHLLSKVTNIFTKYHFISMEVLDLIAYRISQEPEVLANDNRVSLLSIVEAFVQADYLCLPGSFSDAMLNCREKLRNLQMQAPSVYTKFVSLLALLDVAPSALIESVCNEEFVTRAYEIAKKKGHDKQFLQCLNTLHQYRQLYLEDYSGKVLTKSFVEQAMKARNEISGHPADAVLQNFLDIGLGGPRFVLNGLWTRLGHFIDHVIVMRKGDFPVAINGGDEDDDGKLLKYPKSENGFCYVEDLVIPDDAKILAILVARKDWMEMDPPKLNGWATFQQRSLSKLGYNTIILGPPIDELSQDDVEMDHEGF